MARDANHHQHHGDHDHHHTDADVVDFIELSGEVVGAFVVEATTALVALAAGGGLDVRRILDIGSGPGVGSCQFAEAFPSATVLALDGSAEMLARASERVARLGLDHRVTAVPTELPDGLAAIGEAQVVWASMVLHHLGDEAATFRAVRALLPVGGLLGLAEFGEPMRFLPADAAMGRPGLWERLDAATAEWLAGMRSDLPGAAPSHDYPTMLAAAGFEVVTDRVLTVHLDAPLDQRARRVALSFLRRLRHLVDPHLEPLDAAVLDVLVDEDHPDGILRRPDAILHDSRHLYIARAV